MKVFISHSGSRSTEMAKLLQWLISHVIQSARPFMSQADLKPGDRWATRLNTALQDTNFGVLCLTPENLNSRWILFEAGALGKMIDGASVCPVLLSGDFQRISPPLGQFQAVLANREGIWKLISRINGELKEGQVHEDRLELTFAKFWPDVEEKLQSLADQASDSPMNLITDLAREGAIDTLRMVHVLDPFPGFLSIVSHALKQAKKSVKIATDHACYSHFSAPKQSSEYVKTLRDLIAKNIDVQIVLPSKTKQLEILQAQYGRTRGDFERLRRDARYVGTLTGIEKLTGRKISSMNRFFQSALSFHEKLGSDSFGDRISRTDAFPGVFMWITDGRSAIFAIPRHNSEGLEVAFQTSEENIVDVLEKDWESAYRNLAIG